jgi:hypothetical protein
MKTQMQDMMMLIIFFLTSSSSKNTGKLYYFCKTSTRDSNDSKRLGIVAQTDGQRWAFQQRVEFERSFSSSSSSHDRHDQRGWVFARTVERWKKLGFGVVGLCREFWVLPVGSKQHTSKKNKDPRSWVEVRGLSCGMMMRMMMMMME